jgi:DNA replication licensing factor MCM7
MAAANPAYGRYDPYKSPVENIQLPSALLSRFDLLFLLLDSVNAERDSMLAMHVCKVHSNYGGGESKDAKNESDALGLGFKAFDANFMRSYVRKAKTYEPRVDDALTKDIVDAYVSMREEEKKGDVDSRKSYTTPRTLLAILRLSQSHARARFSETVERQDFEEAMRLMKASKESVELSAPTKRGVSPLDVIYDIVVELSRQTKSRDGWVEMAHVVSMGGHKALTREQTLEAIEQWENMSAMVLNPEKTMVKFVVPGA